MFPFSHAEQWSDMDSNPNQYSAEIHTYTYGCSLNHEVQSSLEIINFTSLEMCYTDEYNDVADFVYVT